MRGGTVSSVYGLVVNVAFLEMCSSGLDTTTNSTEVTRWRNSANWLSTGKASRTRIGGRSPLLSRGTPRRRRSL